MESYTGYCILAHVQIFLLLFFLFWLRWVFIATCGLSPLVAVNGGYLLVAVRGLLTELVSLVANNGL